MPRDDDQLVRQAIAQATSSTGGWWRSACPVCTIQYGKEDKRASLGFYPETGFYHCFRCEISGYLQGRFDQYAGDDEQPAETPPIELPEGFMHIATEPAISANATKEARTFLLGRGVDRRTWREARLGITLEGKQRNRIIVPVYHEHRLAGWVGRVWEPNRWLPYVYPEGFKRGDVLWNSNALQIETDKPLLVVEGVFDGLPYWPDASACLGKPTRNQFDLLLEAKRPLAIALDGDAWELGRALSMRLKLKGRWAGFIRIPPKEDPNSVDREWLWSEAYNCVRG
jgi:hypothetical protein